MKKKFKKLIITLSATILMGGVFLPTASALANEVGTTEINSTFDELTDQEIELIKSATLEQSQNENPRQQRGVASVTTKALKKVLKKYGKTIAKKIGGKTGAWLGKNLDKIIKGLDYAGGKARGALKAVLKGLGLKDSTADLWSDIIITVAELFI